MTALERLRRGERWMAWIRLGAVPFAIVQVAWTGGYPSGFEAGAWAVTAVLGAGAIVLLTLSRREFGRRGQALLGLAALSFDAAIVVAYVLLYHWQLGTPIRQLLLVPLIEAAVRYGIRGPIALAALSAPVLVGWELLREGRFDDYSFKAEYVTFQLGVQVLVGLIAGWLVQALRDETSRAEERAAEAEALRDRLGRRADLLDAANRCARALGASLQLEQAFAAFIRELRGLIPFDRATIALAEEGRAQIFATAGVGADTVFSPGTTLPAGSLLEHVLDVGETVYEEDMLGLGYPEEPGLTALGLRSRVVAPLLLGTRPIGVLAVVRSTPAAFSEDEVELVTLLGRLAATAVQNIHSYEAERRTVEELRRLSALRADFVSLVSHELRSPMSAVIGAAQTLQQRWRELSPDHRSSFLGLIADETNRLAALIGDVLDTSRIEAGTFSYAFREVDVADLVRETVSIAGLGQDEVHVRAHTREPLPTVRGDRERLKQVLMNLIENAVKYSPAGAAVDVTAYVEDGCVRIDVRDDGPGIAPEDQKLIFEKFARVNVAGGGKPGSGLGLFIARSIAEAHGGSLKVRSVPEAGATFTLELPV